jgi:thiosulfate dehydrogenase (quinone) large subunit
MATAEKTVGQSDALAQTQPIAARKSIPSDIPLFRALFGNVNWAWIWLIVRLYVGWQWLQAGWEKVTSSAWVGSSAGTALTGFIKGAIAKTTGDHPAVQSWYGTFLSKAVLPQAGIWSYFVAFGELLVGVGLIVGALTGIAAFFGFLMNFNYLMAGSVSTNPYLLVLAILLMLAWKIAGWWGLDRFIYALLLKNKSR